MALRRPESMEELVYHTFRDVGEGEITVWVFRETCPKCKKSLMGKPKNKQGKAMARAKEYVCPSCGFSIEKSEYENSLVANIEYTCPGCKSKGEMQVPFKRKNIDGVLTLRVQCLKCRANMDVTKKMKGRGALSE